MFGSWATGGGGAYRSGVRFRLIRSFYPGHAKERNEGGGDDFSYRVLTDAPISFIGRPEIRAIQEKLPADDSIGDTSFIDSQPLPVA